MSLVGFWPLSEWSGGRANDLSGNDNHGTISGGVTQGVYGVGGLTGYKFNGSDGQVNASNGPVVNDTASVSLWIRPQNLDDRDRVIGGDSVAVLFESTGSSNSNTPRFYFWDSGGTVADTTLSNQPLTLDEWNHVVMTYDGSLGKFYVDGDLEAVSAEDTSSLGRSGTFEIGGDDGTGEWSDSYVSDVRVYDRALSPQEIQTLYEWGSGDHTDPTLTRTQADEVSQIGWDGTGDSGTGFTGLWFSEDGEAVTNTTEIGFQ